MSEYLSKKAVLESISEAYQTSLEDSDQADWEEGYRSALRFVKRTIQSGALDADNSEIQRLRTAAIKLHETLNTYWQGDCDKADVVAAQSKLCDVLTTTTVPTGAERAKAEIADRYKNALHGWHNPVDRAAGSYYNGYLNGVSDTLRLLGITIPGINAPEGEGNDA